MPGQPEQPECMLARVGENANVQIRKRFVDICLGNSQLAAPVFDGDLGQGKRTEFPECRPAFE